MVDARSIPHWLGILLGEKFFDPCIVHKSEKKNEKNIFCLNCCITLCPYCWPFHRPHRRLQIRRYVYQDVLRLNDAQKLINCSLVQPYTTNSAKVVFLNERPMSRPFRGSGNFRIKCHRSLQDPFLFCSLSCKVNHLETAKRDGKTLDPTSELLPLLYKTRTDASFLKLEEDPQMAPDPVLSFRVSPSTWSGGKTLDPTSELLPLLYKTRTDAGFLKLEEDPQMTPDSVMGSPVSPSTWSGGSTNTTVTSNGNSAINCKPSSLVSTATTEFVKKKKRSCVLMPRGSCRGRCSQAAAAESIRHRKGVPQRSPLN